MPWRAYFPDLWVEGFPNVSDDEMSRITRECEIREATLLPKLRKTIECGINRGCDRYWEFALDPVTDHSILVNQVAILRMNGLIPGDTNSLHITLGGIRVDRYAYYVAMVIEALSTSPHRVLSAFMSDNQSKGWGRKGKAGVFEKEGSHDMQHDYNYGTEIRMGQVPADDKMLDLMLDIAQQMGEQILYVQQGIQSYKRDFDQFIGELTSILHHVGLPDTNWKNPHTEPQLWNHYAEVLPSLREPVKKVLENHGYC